MNLVAELWDPPSGTVAKLQSRGFAVRQWSGGITVELRPAAGRAWRYAIPPELAHSRFKMFGIEVGPRGLGTGNAQTVCGDSGEALIPCQMNLAPVSNNGNGRKPRIALLPFDALFKVSYSMVIVRFSLSQSQFILRACRLRKRREAVWVTSRVICIGTMLDVPPQFHQAARAARQKTACASCCRAHYVDLRGRYAPSVLCKGSR